MTLGRCDEANTTVPIQVIVLIDKCLYPFASSLKALKALPRKGAMIFAGPEDGLSKGVVVADSRVTTGWRYPQCLQSRRKVLPFCRLPLSAGKTLGGCFPLAQLSSDTGIAELRRPPD